ncbi:MAG: hypothetical protein IKS19_08165 [Clostridia bacterium]|nr:hypothetical protein [Clostridia bacterium]
MKKLLIAAFLFAFIVCTPVLAAEAKADGIGGDELSFMAKTSPFAKIIADKYDSYGEFVDENSREPLKMSLSLPNGKSILYGDDVYFGVTLNESALKEGERVAIDICSDGGKTLLTKTFYINSDYIFSSKDIVGSLFAGYTDNVALSEGIGFTAAATLYGQNGNQLIESESVDFSISSAGFNVGESGGFMLSGMGRNIKHTDCFTACATHSKTLSWNSFDNAECAITLRRGSSTVFSGTVDGSSFDVYKYYLSGSPDTEYTLSAVVKPKGSSVSEPENTLSAKFVLGSHPSRPSISSVTSDYSRALFSAGSLGEPEIRIALSDSSGNTVYDDYAGQRLDEGKYSATASYRTYPCAGQSAAYSFSITSSQAAAGKVLSQAVDIISAREGTYSTVVRADGKSMSIGKICWHGVNAQLLLKRIMNADPALLKKELQGTTLYNDILKSTDYWKTRICSVAEKPVLSDAISTDTARLVQDAYAEEFIYQYYKYGSVNKKISNKGALIFYCDLSIQGGNGAANRIVNTISGEVTLDKIYKASLSDSVMGRYSTRRTAVYNEIKKLGYTK